MLFDTHAHYNDDAFDQNRKGLLDALPDGRRKSLSIKRAIRDILKSPGGRAEIEKSGIGKILSE